MTLSPENRELVVRAASLYIPVFLFVALIVTKHVNKRDTGAAALVTLWNIPALLLVNAIAVHENWWSFTDKGALLNGMPVEFLLGWAILWGAVAFLAFMRTPLWIVTIIFLLIDVAAMPLLEPSVVLHKNWLLGEALALVLVFLPSQVLARLTSNTKHVYVRGSLQIILFGSLAYWVMPLIAFEVGAGSFEPITDLSITAKIIWMQVLLLLSLPALLGVGEFMRAGGTPFPWDPPTRLVTSGPYAFIRNPMQAFALFSMIAYAILLQNLYVAVGIISLAAFSAGIAEWHENSTVSELFGEEFKRYKKEVRSWIPTWKPTHTNDSVLYVAMSCGPCSDVGAWFTRKKPLGLTVADANDAPQELRPMKRITLQEQNGITTDGIAAVGRAAGQIDFGLAYIGWLVQLPVIKQSVQLLVDAVTSGSKPVE